jgi:hypothetical protein
MRQKARRDNDDGNRGQDQPQLGRVSLTSCALGCRCLTEHLTSKSSEKRVLTVVLLETCVKNCKIEFHRKLFTKKFCEGVLKILEKVILTRGVR